MCVRTDVKVVVVCRDVGQFITPEERHICAVKVAVEVSVALVREVVSSRRAQGGDAAVATRPEMSWRKPLREVLMLIGSGVATAAVATDVGLLRIVM